MKTKSFFMIAAVAAALQFAPTSFAANADAGDGYGMRGRHAKFLASLTPEERAKLRAVHQQVKSDPALQAAKERKRQAAREYRDLKRARMIQADPSIQPILDKLPARGERHHER